MSGIAGIVRLDGGPIHPGEIDAMLTTMRTRGPDAQRGWQGTHVALGQVLLATTPEALAETQPWVDPLSGCVVVSDSRLDNRGELLRMLDFHGVNPDDVGDGELLFRAWRKWGVDCAVHLLGDFAFAIWNEREKTLFCARDVMGVRPFYYHYASGKRFVLGSETQAILTQPIPDALNEGRIADALVAELESIDKTSTPFQSILRLPPASWLLLRNGQLRLQEYWHPFLNPPAELARSDDAWIDELRACIRDAVRCRLRSCGEVGSMLSGGVDSSAVVALADEALQQQGSRPLATFSAINSAGYCDETEGVRLMLNARRLTATLVDLQSGSHIQKVTEKRLDSLASPFDGCLTLVDAMYWAAAQRGTRSVMDGMPADNLYSVPWMAGRLLTVGRLSDSFHESRLAHRLNGSSLPAVRATLNLGMQFAPRFIHRIKKRVADGYYFNKRLVEGTLISQSYVRSVDLWGRYLQYRDELDRGAMGDPTGAGWSGMTQAFITAAVERYGRASATHGIEARHPFLDRRLIEFHAWLPIRLRRTTSVDKWALRRAIDSIVPPEIAWAARREHLGWRFSVASVRGLAGYCAELPAVLGGRIESAKLSSAMSRWVTFEDYHAFEAVKSALSVSLWLRCVSKRIAGVH